MEADYTYWLDLRTSPYWVSATDNKFTAIGCDTLAYFSEYTDKDFTTGCVSVCSNLSSVRGDGSCSGIGCCQTPVPWGLKRFNVTLTSFFYHTRSGSFNPCSFAFLAEQDWFTFNLADISALSLQRSNIPVVMDWAIGNQTCEKAKQDTKSYACGPNSNCSDSTNGPGYRCYCKDGFEGNPYLPQGCQDINECETGHNNWCYERAICNNNVGSYSCYCPKGYHGDGLKNGTRCTEDLKSFPLIKIIAVTAVQGKSLPWFALQEWLSLQHYLNSISWKITHCFREANPIADYLAKSAAKTGLSGTMEEFPTHIIEEIRCDSFSKPRFRFCRQLWRILLMAMLKVVV